MLQVFPAAGHCHDGSSGQISGLLCVVFEDLIEEGGCMEPVLRQIEVKSILTKSNLPVADYSVNPYTGCAHACRYCYASFMKRFSNHPEPWGGFVDVKLWPGIRHKERYAGADSSSDPSLTPISRQRRSSAGHGPCWSSCRAAVAESALQPSPTWC